MGMAYKTEKENINILELRAIKHMLHIASVIPQIHNVGIEGDSKLVLWLLHGMAWLW